MRVQVDEVKRAAVMQMVVDGPLSNEQKKHFVQTLAMTRALYAGTLDGKLICTWGLIPPTLMSDQAYLWLFTTPELDGNEFMFIRHSQIEIARMLETYPTITGITAASNTQAIRWIKWLGGEFYEGANGFLPFVIRKK